MRDKKRQANASGPPNPRDSYALVNEDGEIIEKFRQSATAHIFKKRYEKKSMQKLKVVTLIKGYATTNQARSQNERFINL